MSTIRFLLLPAVVLLAPALTGAQEGKKTKRPNILILIADDWSYPHAGAFGDKVVKTPHIDRLAKQGVVFTRAYTAAPSCTPSRAALLTGQAVHRLAEGGNLHGYLPDRFTCFVDLLQRTGYVLGLVGKGWGPGTLEHTQRKHNPAGPKAKNFRDFLASKPKDAPFCFWFGSSNPHRPYKKGAGAALGLKAADVAVPPIWPDTPEVRDDILDYYSEVMDFDRQIGEILAALEEAGLAGDTLIFVLSDNGMPFPRGKATMYDLGIHMPMIAVWPRQVPVRTETEAVLDYTSIAPTILEACGVKVPADMTGKSFLPLLLTGKGGKAHDFVVVERERHAHVRKGNLSYPARALRDRRWLYIRNFRPDRWPAGDPQHVFSVGPFGDVDDGPTKRAVMKLAKGTPEERRMFEWSFGKRPAEELYDCEADPFQQKNLAADPAHAKTRDELRARMQRWMQATGDPRAGADGGDDRWDTYPYFGRPGKKKK